MAKYKVGDKVRAREDLVVGYLYGKMRYDEEMDKHKGRILTVDAICDGYYWMEETHFFGWTDEMLEGDSWLNNLEFSVYNRTPIDVPLKTYIAHGASTSQKDMLIENKSKYCYDDRVLINKFDIHDLEALDALGFEGEVV